ncbi:UNVERIFIED_ORG: transposase [Microbispora rosea subsp. rosea]
MPLKSPPGYEWPSQTPPLRAWSAELLSPAAGNDAKLAAWLTDARAANLPHLHGFANGLELDREAVNAAITLPHHNGRTEGVNTRTKRIMRQMHGRAGFDLLRHRILLH